MKKKSTIDQTFEVPVIMLRGKVTKTGKYYIYSYWSFLTNLTIGVSSYLIADSFTIACSNCIVLISPG